HVNGSGHAPDRPLHLNIMGDQPLLLWQDRAGHTHGYGRLRWWIEGQVEPGDSSRKHVDCQRDPWSAYRQTVNIIHQDNICRGVIDLDDRQWILGIGEGTWCR